MKIKIISNNDNKALYDKQATHPLQSWEWGEARKKMGIDVLRIGEYHDEKLLNVFQITFHKIPHTPFTIGYLPRSAVPSSEVLEYLAAEGKKRNSIFIKIEPYMEKNTSHVIASDSPTSEERGNLIGIATSQAPRDDRLVLSSHPLFPNWTQMIDLTKSEDTLLKSMHPKTRYNIRLAQKKGVVVKEVASEEGFGIFSKLYFDTCRRQGYRGHTEQYHKTVFEALKKNIAHILIAYYENTPLTAYELFIFNDVLYYPYGGSSEDMKNVMAPNLLMWEAIRVGKKNGAKKFDMWGSLPPDYPSTSLRTSSWAGFTRFKEGYGGEFVEFVGSYDLVINPLLLYNIYNVVHSARRKLLSIL